MLKKLFSITAIFLSTLTVNLVIGVTQTQAVILSWEQLVDDGFGRTTPFGSEDFFDLYTWNGCVYAGIEGKNTTEGALVYRSCNGTTFELVSPLGFGDPTENDHVDSIYDFNDYLYVSTAVPNASFNGFKLWRSPNGNVGSWEAVITDGFGTNTNENLKDLVTFNGELCGGTRNSTNGAAVLCSPDGVTWRQVNTYGFGNPNNQIAWRNTVFKGYLYFSVQNSATGGEVWRTKDLSTWEKVIDNGYGFGTGEAYLQTPTTFGEFLYLFPKNGSNAPFVIRSSDGINFETVHTFDVTTHDGAIANAVFYDNHMYVSIYDPTAGTVVYRTRSGESWGAVSLAGFDGTTANSYAHLAVFNDYLYAGVENTSTGQQVWRARLPLGDSLTQAPNGPAPGCTDVVTDQVPELFQVDTTETTATLFFTPVTNNANAYGINYGLSDYQEAKYGTKIDVQSRDGVQIVKINELIPAAKYYFKVQPINGCKGGSWSNQIEVETTKPEQKMTRRQYLYSKVIDFISQLVSET